MREELFWDTVSDKITPEIEIERAINFGGFDFIKEVQERYGMGRFIDVLINGRGLSKKSVNYWCWILNIDKHTTNTFKIKGIWRPTR